MVSSCVSFAQTHARESSDLTARRAALPFGRDTHLNAVDLPAKRLSGSWPPKRCASNAACPTMSRSRDEDQQLGSTVDGRLHPVRDPTIHAAGSPTNRAARLSTTWPSPQGRRIDFSTISFSVLQP
jgi:hypothetical protein